MRHDYTEDESGQFDVIDEEMKKNHELSMVELQRILLARCNLSLCTSYKFSMECVLAFSIKRVLVQNALQLTRNFGVPAAFYVAFHLRSSNAFPVRLLLSSTVWLLIRVQTMLKHIHSC